MIRTIVEGLADMSTAPLGVLPLSDDVERKLDASSEIFSKRDTAATKREKDAKLYFRIFRTVKDV